MSAADDQTGRRHDRVGALPSGQLGIFFYTVEWHFRSAAEDGENRSIAQKIDSVITPFPRSDFTSVKTQYAIELAAIEGHPGLCGGGRRSSCCLAAMGIARLSFAKVHWRLLLELRHETSHRHGLEERGAKHAAGRNANSGITVTPG